MDDKEKGFVQLNIEDRREIKRKRMKPGKNQRSRNEKKHEITKLNILI